MDIVHEIRLVEGIMGNVGYHLWSNGFRNTRRNRWIAAMHVAHDQPECIARLRDVDWLPIEDMLEERSENQPATICGGHK